MQFLLHHFLQQLAKPFYAFAIAGVQHVVQHHKLPFLLSQHLRQSQADDEKQLLLLAA